MHVSPTASVARCEDCRSCISSPCASCSPHDLQVESSTRYALTLVSEMTGLG